MKSKSSFRLGKNYDSDYLCGKRLKRKTIKQRNQNSYRHKYFNNKSTPNHVNYRQKKEKPLDAIEKSKHNLPKIKNKRLTLGLKTKSYHKNGIFANGMTSRVVTNDMITQNDRQSRARVNEDLLWILSKGNDLSKSGQNVLKRKAKPEPIFEKQNNNFAQSSHQINDKTDNQINANIQKPKTSLIRVNQTQNRGEISMKSNEKKLTKIRVHQEMSEKSKERKNPESVEHSTRPVVPSSLSIVENLMKCYENERNVFAKQIPEFKVDLLSKTCEQLRAIALPLNSRLNKEWIENRIQSRIESNEINSKNKQIVKQTPDLQLIESVSAVHSSHNQNAVTGDNNLVVFQPKQLQSNNAKHMMSRILRNVSEALQSLSARCLDPSFFD